MLALSTEKSFTLKYPKKRYYNPLEVSIIRLFKIMQRIVELMRLFVLPHYFIQQSLNLTLPVPIPDKQKKLA